MFKLLMLNKMNDTNVDSEFTGVLLFFHYSI